MQCICSQSLTISLLLSQFSMAICNELSVVYGEFDLLGNMGNVWGRLVTQ
jgi:hypothetical protein